MLPVYLVNFLTSMLRTCVQLIGLVYAGYVPGLMAQNVSGPVVANSTVAFTIREKDAHIESIAYDALTRTFYLGAIHKRKILQHKVTGQISDFRQTAQDSLYSVLGLQVDTKRRVLWACATALPQMTGYNAADKNKAAVFKYALDKPRLLGRYTLPNDGKTHVLGEPLVASNGDVYVSDSGNPAIYRIRNGSNTLELFLQTALRSLQGIAFSADEQVLFIADYATGIHRYDLISRQLVPLQKADGLNDRGTDGLYVYQNQLIAIQNGLSPSRVVRFTLNKTLTRLDAVVPLELNNPQFNEPTLGVVVGDRLYYVANSQWGSYTKENVMFPPEELADGLILKVNLK